MTISSDDRIAGPFNGNGSQTAFPFAFKVFGTSDLLVVRADANGTESTLVLDSDYSVALNADQDANPGGTVTYPISGTALPVGETVTITTDLEYLQPTDITNAGGFYPQVIEDALDRNVVLIQQIAQKADRALQVAVSTPSGVDVVLPPPVASKVIGWNDTATGLVNRDIADFATTIAFASWQSQYFSGNGATTQFILSSDPGNVNNLDVALSGVGRGTADYSLNGTTLTFAVAPPSGTNNIFVRWGDALPQGSLGTGTVTDTTVAAGAAIKASKLAFTPTDAYVAQSFGAAVKDGVFNVMWLVTSEAERAAIRAYTSTTDHTALINAALAYSRRVYVPAGRWNIDTDVGVVLPSGFSIVGDGPRTMFVALARGATQAELVAYTKGSMFKRAFTVGVANAYVANGYLADFSVILNPQTPYNAANYKQIGIDLRNITRSVVERVFVSNCTDSQTHPWAVIPAVALSAADQTQNYGIVIGTRAGAPDYCGGERNTVRDSHAWGLYKNITIDDTVLSPASSAHQTTIDTCEAQGGHELITQGSQYNAGTVLKNLTVQGLRRQTGNANPTVAVGMSGYNGAVDIAYAELGTACDVLLSLSSSSKQCDGRILYYSSSAPSTASITDTGTQNNLRYPAPVLDTVPTPNVTSGFGPLVELFNKAYRRVYAKFHYDGVSAMVLDESIGVASVTRTGVGAYTVVLSKAMPTRHWVASAILDADASGHLGGVCVVEGSQSTTNFRFFTYSQNGATTTQIDPRFVYFTGVQV